MDNLDYGPDAENSKRDCLLIELLVRVSSLEALLINNKIITEEQLVETNVAEGKRITEELKKEVEKMAQEIMTTGTVQGQP